MALDFSISDTDVLTIECDALVVGKFEDEEFGKAAKRVDDALSMGLSKACEDEGFRGEMGKSCVISTLGKITPKRVMVVGMGKRGELSSDTLRKVAVHSAKKLKTTSSKITYALDVPQEEGFSASLVEGTLLGSYEFVRYKTKKEGGREITSVHLVFENPDEEGFRREENFAKTLAEATNFARDLVNEPPVYLTPTRLAMVSEEVAREAGLKVVVLGKEDMMERGMGGILAVNKGSAEPPVFIHLMYEPDVEAKKTVALVGKGVTFDSGGLSLKPAESMRTMKMDMAGGAAVIAVMKVLSRLGVPCRVHGLIPSTENMTGGNAYKVDDVIRIMNGKTIEVVNTDAEGRIILADAISYAVELGVDEIIDLATLTGACVVALGNYTAGLFGNSSELVEGIKKAAQLAGEKVWQLPLDEELRKQLDSDVADLKNAGGRWGGAITGAFFLESFVSGKPWAHLDIAGPAFLEKGSDYMPIGGTGFGVRTIIRYLLEA
jgi:leucyl aminopeptidase